METTVPALKSNVAGLCKPQTVPVVCIGMSSGGIPPLKMIFKQLSTKTGLAFVIIHHVRKVPTRLPELLSAWTEMPVALAREGKSICPNSVYVLPSGMEIMLSDGSFAMRAQTKRRGFSNVLTVFLESLSKGSHPGVAVFLSGLDADGAAALDAFRRHGGFAIAQEPRTAESASMPLSAIRECGVDEVLPPEAIAGKFEELAQQFKALQFDPERGREVFNGSKDDGHQSL